MKKQGKKPTTKSRDQKRKSKLSKRSAAKSRQDSKFKFFTWDQLKDMYEQTAREVLINGRTVVAMLKRDAVTENLEKSPGSKRLVDSFSVLTNSLTKELLEIRKLHTGRTGQVNMDDPESMDAVMEIYERYNRISNQATGEYASCIATLKELETAPALFMNEEESAQFSELNDALTNKAQVEGAEAIESTPIEEINPDEEVSV